MSLAPKKFLNETSNAVNEVIEGLLLTHPNKLQRLDGHDVVLLNPIPKQQKVHLLCGGGSGHEPCFGGYVGNGMLSGAVCGGVSYSNS
jgi:dihydroxyacetone kinase